MPGCNFILHGFEKAGSHIPDFSASNVKSVKIELTLAQVWLNFHK